MKPGLWAAILAKPLNAQGDQSFVEKANLANPMCVITNEIMIPKPKNINFMQNVV